MNNIKFSKNLRIALDFLQVWFQKEVIPSKMYNYYTSF